MTHRVAWEDANGPVPDGKCVLHKCDNPPCCNPEHLFLGTREENNADRDAKGRTAKGEKASFRLDPIFKGGISSGSLRALYAFLGEKKDEFDCYVIPAVGNYTAAQAIVQSGAAPDQIHCSDTNLYSAVLGFLFDPTLKIDDLGFQVMDSALEALLTKSPAKEYGEEIIAAARILYALKWCQLSSETEYKRGLRREVEEAVEMILNSYAHTLVELNAMLGGMHFELRGAQDHIPDEIGNKSALIVFNTTQYARVTPATNAFTWTYPSGMFLKSDESKRVDIGDASACILLYGGEELIDSLAEAEDNGSAALYDELNVKKKTRVDFR